MCCAWREPDAVSKIVLHPLLQPCTRVIITIVCCDIFAWFIDSTYPDVVSQAPQGIPEIRYIVERLTSFGIEVLPTSDDVPVHQNRSVQGKGLGGDTWRSVMNLRKEEKLALFHIREEAILPFQVRRLHHFAFATFWYSAPVPILLIFCGYKDACHLKLATHHLESLFSEGPIFAKHRPANTLRLCG